MGNKLAIIGVNQTAVKPSPVFNEKGFFSSITCSVAGTITVKGIGIMEYIASGSAITGHIDPVTGTTGVGNAPAAGYYEALEGTQVAIPMVAGDTIGGHFHYIVSDGNFKGHAYAVQNYNRSGNPLY